MGFHIHTDQARMPWVSKLRRDSLGVGLIALVLSAALNAVPAQAEPKPTIGPATVVTFKHQEESDGVCTGGATGFIRWPAIKGVSSYTVVFNDAAYGGAEKRVPVAADAEGDWPADTPPEGAMYPQANAPKGQHQLIWTGSTYGGPAPCQPDTTDYSTRLTNAHTEYTREGEFIDGIVTGPCEDDACPPTRGVKVSAKGDGGGSDTTDAIGRYSIKVKKGDYTVVPSKGTLDFEPKQKQVHVGANKTATANFRASALSYDLEASYARFTTAVVGTDRIRFEGTNWDPEGGAISVKHEDTVLDRFKAASSFHGTVEIPTFSKNSCTDSLTFNQDGLRRRFAYSAKVTQVVDYVRGRATADGERRLRKGDNVCDGERVHVDRDATFVAHTTDSETLRADDGAYLGARVEAPWALIELKSVSAPQISLGFEKGKPAVAVPPGQVPVGSTFAEAYDTERYPDTPGFTDGERVEGDMRTCGAARGNGSLTVTGDIAFAPGSCNPAVYPDRLLLFVDGNLTVGGRLFPRPGYIATTGTLTFSGPRSGWGDDEGLVASLTRIEIED
jgi:hypothetical protein